MTAPRTGELRKNDDVPQWIADLVPLADDARAIFLGRLPLLSVLVVFALLWALGPGDYGPPQIMLASYIGSIYAFNAEERHSHTGIETTMLLLVADLILSLLALGVAGVAALMHVPHPLLVGALAGTISMCAVSAGLLVRALPLYRTRWGRNLGQGMTLLVVVIGSTLALRFFPYSPWWVAGAIAVVADLLGVVAVREARRRQKSSGEPAPADRSERAELRDHNRTVA